MLARLDHRGCHYLLLGALGLALFITNLGGPSLWDLDEGRNATCAAEMMEADNWVIPTFNGDLRVDKPALLYWLQIAAYNAFGVNEFSARLPSALAALAAVLLCYELARSMFSPSTGLLAGVAAASTPMLCGAARFANPDALLNLFMVLTLTVFWLGRERPGLGWFAAIGAAEGFGMLAKGPIAVAAPAGILTLFLLWEGRLRLLADARWLVGAAAFVVVAAPWYVWVAAETKGEFVRRFFLEHNVGRYVSSMEGHHGGPWYYPVVLTLGMFPWSIFLGPAAWFGYWSARPGAVAGSAAERGPRAARRRSAHRLLACWIGLYLVFFTISATKLPNYALPVLVPTAILVARFLDRWRLGAVGVSGWVMPTSLACLALLGAGLSAGLLAAAGAWETGAPRAWYVEGLGPWAALGLLPIVGVAVGLWCVRAGQRTGLIVSVATTGVLLLVPIVAFTVALLDAHKPVRDLVRWSGALRRDEDIRVVSWHLDHLPSLNFYVQRNVRGCDVPEDQVGRELAAHLSYPIPVFVFLPASEWERLRPAIAEPCRELARHPDLYRHDDVVVITNR
jgi:4-amino-4-deoxy-L-arabinose transferase-like glycosyltransferase